MEMIILTAIIALAAGLGAGYALAYARTAPLRSEAVMLKSKLAEKDAYYTGIINERETAHSRIEADTRRAYQASLQREKEVNREALAALQSSFDATIDSMKAHVNSVTSDMLRSRQTEFEATNRAAMETITAPLRQTIEQMKLAMADNTRTHADLGGQLSANIRQVLEQSESARQSADRLASVLSAGGKLQGDCGEVILRELLESQNLKPGIHFHLQTILTDTDGNSILSDEGRELQPDVIVDLGQNRCMMIDSKVSLTSYFRYCDAETDELRKVALREHIASIEKHVRELVKKNYGGRSHQGKDPMQFTVMFMPYSAALRVALNAKPSLWREAMQQRIYIADEETLFAALKIVELTWQTDDRARNHEKVYALADELLGRVNDFLTSFSQVGDSLRNASEAFGAARAKLTEGGQSIPTTCRQLKELGAATRLTARKKEHPLLRS